MTADEFKAGIRQAIESAIQGPGEVFGEGAFGDDHLLHVEGTWIDTTELAEAIHTYIVDTLKPPF